MIIRRSAPKTQYLVLANDVPEDTRISYEALGVLVYLLAKPPDWEVNINDLRNRRSGSRERTGRDKVYRIINELIDARYIIRDMDRAQDGKFSDAHYAVYDQPQPENPHTEKPDTEKPYTEKPEDNKYSLPQSTQVNQVHTPPADAEASSESASVFTDDEAIKAFIHAYEKGLPAKPPENLYNRKVVREQALELATDGLAPQDIEDYTRLEKSRKFWSGRAVPWKYVVSNVRVWIADGRPYPADAPKQAHQPAAPPPKSSRDADADAVAERMSKKYGRA